MGNGRGTSRALLLAGAAVILSGCVSAADPEMFAVQGFTSGTSGLADAGMAVDPSAQMAMNGDAASETAAGVPMPVPSPSASDAANRMPASMDATAQTAQSSGQSVVMANTAVDALNRGITQTQTAQPVANLYTTPAVPVAVEATDTAQQPAAEQAAPSAETVVSENDASVAEPQPPVQELAVVAPPKKKSIFARMFAPQKTSSRDARAGTKKRLVSQKPDRLTVASAGASALPGVNVARALGTESLNAPTDPDSGQIQLASAAGLARLAPNGLHLQTEKVEVACFKPQLVRTLKSIERHYGRPVMVTSGYRSPKAQPQNRWCVRVAPHLLRGSRHPGRGRFQMAVGKVPALDAGPGWCRYLLPYGIGSHRHRKHPRLELALPSPQVKPNRKRPCLCGAFHPVSPWPKKLHTDVIFFSLRPIIRLRSESGLIIRRLIARALRLSVRTPDFHSGKRGSTPLGRATLFKHLA
jgi:uncharacterized protein YcbK (DUF882 family)